MNLTQAVIPGEQNVIPRTTRYGGVTLQSRPQSFAPPPQLGQVLKHRHCDVPLGVLRRLLRTGQRPFAT